MRYILSVSFFPIGRRGNIICSKRFRLYSFNDFHFVLRKLRYLKRVVYVLDYYIEDTSDKV